jgi:hypothetical protein
MLPGMTYHADASMPQGPPAGEITAGMTSAAERSLRLPGWVVIFSAWLSNGWTIKRRCK